MDNMIYSTIILHLSLSTLDHMTPLTALSTDELVALTAALLTSNMLNVIWLFRTTWADSRGCVLDTNYNTTFC